MRQTRIVLLALAVLVTALVTACAGSPKPSSISSASASVKTFTSATYHYTFVYDSNYFRLGGDSSAICLSTRAARSADSDSVCFEPGVTMKSGNVAAFLHFATAASRNNLDTLPGEYTKRLKRITLNGMPGIRSEAWSAKVHFVWYWLLGRHDAYLIPVVVKEKSWQSVGPRIEAVLQSLHQL